MVSGSGRPFVELMFMFYTEQLRLYKETDRPVVFG